MPLNVRMDLFLDDQRIIWTSSWSLSVASDVLTETDCEKKQEVRLLSTWACGKYSHLVNDYKQSLQAKVDALTKEEREIVQRQEVLKKDLYGRFGDSINLEN